MRTGTVSLLVLLAGAFQVGAPGLAATVESNAEARAVAPAASALDSLNEIATLTEPVPTTDDQFGRNVGISGNTVIVGAHADHGRFADTGAAYVFERNQGGLGAWGLVRKLDAMGPDPETNDDDFDQHQGQFGIRVAIDVDTAVVGAFGEDIGSCPPNNHQLTGKCINVGAAYVFERDVGGPDQWGRVARLTASDGGFNHQFGKAVAIDGDTIVVGAFVAPGNAIGAAYVYERDAGGPDQWGQVKKLVASDGLANDQFGITVGVSGDLIVVGAWADDHSGFSDAGSAYVFERDQPMPDQWGEVKKITAIPDLAEFDYFGGKVRISGDTILVGAHADDHLGLSNPGSAYIFERDAGGPDNWGRVKKLTASDAQPNDQFGISVALSDDLAVVGAFADEFGAGPDSGSAYVYQRDLGGPGNWGESKKLVNSDPQANDFLGWTSAVSGNLVILGAPNNVLVSPIPPGAAHIFLLPPDNALRYFISDAEPLRTRGPAPLSR